MVGLTKTRLDVLKILADGKGHSTAELCQRREIKRSNFSSDVRKPLLSGGFIDLEKQKKSPGTRRTRGRPPEVLRIRPGPRVLTKILVDIAEQVRACEYKLIKGHNQCSKLDTNDPRRDKIFKTLRLIEDDKKYYENINSFFNEKWQEASHRSIQEDLDKMCSDAKNALMESGIGTITDEMVMQKIYENQKEELSKV